MRNDTTLRILLFVPGQNYGQGKNIDMLAKLHELIVACLPIPPSPLFPLSNVLFPPSEPSNPREAAAANVYSPHSPSLGHVVRRRVDRWTKGVVELEGGGGHFLRVLSPSQEEED